MITRMIIMLIIIYTRKEAYIENRKVTALILVQLQRWILSKNCEKLFYERIWCKKGYGRLEELKNMKFSSLGLSGAKF